MNALNGKSGLTSDGSLLYQINEARVGPEGQGVNQFLNGPAGADFTTTTPWIWSVIQFDANGFTEAFLQNTINSTSQNLAIFPSYWVYTNGFPVIGFRPANVMTFIRSEFDIPIYDGSPATHMKRTRQQTLATCGYNSLFFRRRSLWCSQASLDTLLEHLLASP